jgi:hypothetical protein
MSAQRSSFSQLKWRNVVRVAGLYLRLQGAIEIAGCR